MNAPSGSWGTLDASKGPEAKDAVIRFINETLLQLHKAEEIMTKNVAKVEPDDHIAVAVEVFKENILHALPVVENGELVGIITAHDIIKMISKDKISDLDYKASV